MPDPKPPRPRPVPLVPVVPTRGDRRSHDNVEAVLAQEAHERRERELLAELAEEQEARAEAERARAETERRVAELERLAKHAQQQQGHSVAPKAESGTVDVRARLTAQQIVTLLAAAGALIASIVSNLRQQPPPPKIVDNSATISELQAEISRQAVRIQALAKHQRLSEDWSAVALGAAGVKVVRPPDSRELPIAIVSTSEMRKRPPPVRLENPQPVLAGKPDEAVPAPAAQP